MDSKILELLETEHTQVLFGGPNKSLLHLLDVLKANKEMDPRLLAIIVKQLEEDAIHKRAIEKTVIDKTFRAALWDHLFMLIRTIIIVVLVYFYMASGHASEGMSIAIGVMGTIASLISVKRWPGAHKREEKKR